MLTKLFAALLVSMVSIACTGAGKSTGPMLAAETGKACCAEAKACCAEGAKCCAEGKACCAEKSCCAEVKACDSCKSGKVLQD